MAKTARRGSKAPWDRKNPRKKAKKPSTRLTPAKKQEARSRARAAGRPYPNLVDNMAVTRKAKAAKTVRRRKATKKR